MKVREYRKRHCMQEPVMTYEKALAWLERHDYQETTDGMDGWRSFTDEPDEIAGYHYCKTAADIIGLVQCLIERGEK